MLNLRVGLLAIAMLMLFVPTGCKDDTSDPPLAPETTTSPTQLVEWLEQLGAIIRATNTSGEEASRIIAYASIAYYEGYAPSNET